MNLLGWYIRVQLARHLLVVVGRDHQFGKVVYICEGSYKEVLYRVNLFRYCCELFCVTVWLTMMEVLAPRSSSSRLTVSLC